MTDPPTSKYFDENKKIVLENEPSEFILGRFFYHMMAALLLMHPEHWPDVKETINKLKRNYLRLSLAAWKIGITYMENK